MATGNVEIQDRIRKIYSFVNFKLLDKKVAWPSGLRRWFKAPVSSEAWVQISPLPYVFVSIII